MQKTVQLIDTLKEAVRQAREKLDSYNRMRVAEKRVEELLATNSQVDAINASLLKKNKNLEIQVEELKGENAACPAAIDWKKLNVVSVERIHVNTVPQTVIGYKNEEHKVKEWFLQVNTEQHDKLVKQYAEYLDGKETSSKPD